VIRVEGASKRFGDVLALDDVSITVRPGEVLGLLGPNGAGKTTLVRILATLLRPDRGRVVLGGHDVADDPASVRSLIGLAGQLAAVDELLTGRENLALVGRLYGLRGAERRERTEEVLEQVDLVDVADRRVGTYSGGMRRRLDLAATLVGCPAVLLLDEPTTGLDPRSRADVWHHVRELATAGTTVVLTSQHMDEVEHLADRVVVLDRGRVIAGGTPDQLKHEVGGTLVDVFFAFTGGGPGAVAVAPAPTEVLAPAEETEALPVARRRTGTADSLAVTGRALRHLLRTPQLLFFALVQPVLFLVALTPIFGTLVEQHTGVDYIQYLLPGVLVMTTVLSAGSTGVALAVDLQAGIIDRFRSLPMARHALLVGRTVADLARNAAAMVLLVVVGLAMGFEPHGGVARNAAGLGTVLLFGYALTWVFAAVGLAVRDVQTATFLGFAPVLPLVFLSGSWIPVDAMAGGLQAFARNQPVNVAIEAARTLLDDGPGDWVLRSILWSLAILAVFAGLAVRTYTRSTGD
jgi:ABC transporter DrrB family efflux protein